MKNFKKIASLFFVAMAMVSLCACGGSDTKNPTTTASEESGEVANGQTEYGNVLIAYFTAAENSGVDAVASASYSTVDGEAVGRLRAIADMIQDTTGGEVFSIRTSVVYPADGGELIDYAAEEQEENARPELTSHIEDLAQYNTIFVGYPNWWGDMPMIIYTFLDEYDLSGKTVAPFNTSGGSGFSNSLETIAEMEPDAQITEGLSLGSSEAGDCADTVSTWLDSIGLAE